MSAPSVSPSKLPGLAFAFLSLFLAPPLSASAAAAAADLPADASESPATGAAQSATPAAPVAPAIPTRLLEFSYEDWTAILEGEWRLRGTFLTALEPVDSSLIRDAQQPDSTWIENRLRLDPSVAWKGSLGPLTAARFVAQADFAEGVIGGDDVPPRAIRDDDIDVADLNHLWGEASFSSTALGSGVLRVGRQGSKWGLGLVANDGIGAAPMGDKRYGDRVDRVALRVSPVTEGWARPLVLALAVDRPVEDDLTRNGWRDHAWNFIASALYAGPQLKLGLYDVFRSQRNENDTNTRIDLVDVYLSYRDESWVFEGEGVVAAGNTELVSTPASPSQADVLEHGAALSGGWSSDELDLLLDAGYASGDADPFDDEVRGFTFDPDFNVGIILFEEYLAALTAASAFNLGDPALVGGAAPGAYLVDTRGGVTNAVYLNPRAVWRSERDEGWEAKLGVLWAQALEDLVDPFESFVAGGSPRNFLGGAPGSRDLGVEIDGGIAYRIRADQMLISVGAEAGGYWPGAAFESAGGAKPDAITLVQGRLSARW